MTTNPFEHDNGRFLVLVNDEERHSLWSEFAELPAGWRVLYGDATGADCLDFVEQNWTDIWPKILRNRLAQGVFADF